MRAVFSTAEAARITGVTERQLDLWARGGVVQPSLMSARGSGSQRRWSIDDLALLVLARTISDTGGFGRSGVPRERLRQILDTVRPRVPADGLLVVGATSTSIVAGLDEVVLDGATVVVSLE